MKCTRCQECLQDFLDETLEPAERAELAEHLAVCEACRGELEALRKVAALVGSLDELPEPEGFLQGVRARLERVSVWERMRELLTRPLRPGYSVAIPVIIVAFFAVFLVMNLRVPEKAQEPQADKRNAPFEIARHDVESPVPNDGNTLYYGNRTRSTVEGETEESRDYSTSDAGAGDATTPGEPTPKAREELSLGDDKLNLKPKTDTYKETDSDRPEESEIASTARSSEKLGGSATAEEPEEEAPAGPTEEANKSLEGDRTAGLRSRTGETLDETAGASTPESKEVTAEVLGDVGGEQRVDEVEKAEEKQTKNEVASEQDSFGVDLERETITLGGPEGAYKYERRGDEEVINLVVFDLPTDRAHVERIVADAGGRITELRTKAALNGLLLEVPDRSFAAAFRLLSTYNAENARALEQQDEAQRQKATAEQQPSVNGQMGQQQSLLRTLPLIVRRLVEKQAVTQPAETQQQGEQRESETPQ